LPVSGDKARVNLLSTVTNDGELHFQVYTSMMNAALFLAFLERLVAGAARKVFLIVDPLPAHVAAAVQDWVWAHGEQIELFTLPVKTPERNPVEYLNNDQPFQGECVCANLLRCLEIGHGREKPPCCSDLFLS